MPKRDSLKTIGLRKKIEGILAQSDTEFDTALDSAIESIYQASIAN